VKVPLSVHALVSPDGGTLAAGFGDGRVILSNLEEQEADSKNSRE
jgi:hypothetical protein